MRVTALVNMVRLLFELTIEHAGLDQYYLQHSALKNAPKTKRWLRRVAKAMLRCHLIL